MNEPQRRTPAPKTKPLRREWLTVDQAAEYIGVHPKTIRKWYRAGRIPAYTVAGGPIRIDRPDLDAVTARLYQPGGAA